MYKVMPNKLSSAAAIGGNALSHRFVRILHELVEALPGYVGGRPRSFPRQRRIVLILVVLVPGGFWKGLQ